MSSLLANDFEEEFYRVENNLKTNKEEFIIDREGNLIYTTPIIRGSKITADVLAFNRQNIAPEKVNIIFDSVSFISTNPNVSNYLPLKIDFGGKPQLEFSSPEVTVLNNYKIIVNPAINIPTIKVSDFGTFSSRAVIEVGGVGAVVNRVVDMGILVDDNNQPNNERVLLNVEFSLPAVQRRIFSYQIASPNAVVEYVPAAPPASTGEYELFTNRKSQVAVILQRNPAYVVSVNHSDTSFTEQILIAPALDEIFIAVLYPTNESAVIVTRKSDSSETYLRFWNRLNDISTTQYLLEASYTINLVDIISAYRYASNRYFLLDLTGRVFEISFDIENIPITSLILTTDTVDEVIALYAGGDNVERPNINIFTYGSNTLRHYQYVGLEASNVSTKTYTLSTRPSIRRWDNQAYFVDSQIVYLINLDRFVDLSYSPKARNNMSPRIVDSMFFTLSSPTLNRLLLSGLTVEGGNKVFISFSRNNGSLNQVTKISFNYTERYFPYQVSSDRFSFNIALPNGNPVDDLRIFKYVIDFRIQYSKKRLEFNPSKPVEQPLPTDDLLTCLEECEDGVPAPKLISECKDGDCDDSSRKERCADGRCSEKRKDGDSNCKVRCNRAVGSAKRVLGLVGEDFNVSDFLNIYSTR